MLAVQAVAANSLFQVMNFPVHTSEIPCFVVGCTPVVRHKN